MAYAKIDVAFLRDHFSQVEEKKRPAAVALYLELVLASAEMLLDGNVPRRVVEAGAHEIGISRGRYSRREIASAATSLVGCGVVDIATDSMWRLIYWHDHHSSRAEVDDARKAAAERKRKSRGQMTLSDERGGQPSGVTQEVTEGQDRDSRAHARRRSAANTKKDLPLHEPELDRNHAGNPNDEEPELEEPAAAEAAATERAILEACTRFGAEPNIAEPWARQLTGADLTAITAKMEMKIRRGTVERVPGQFVDLLQRQVRANIRTSTAVTVKIPTLEETLHADVLSYARGQHPWDVAAELLSRKMTKLDVPAERHASLLAELEAAYINHRDEEPDLDHAAA